MLPEPPKAHGLPLLGQALHLARGPEAALQRLYRKYGPIFQFDAAHFNYICMAGPDANEFINGAGKDCFSSRQFWQSIAAEIGTPNVVIGLDGQDHRDVRRALKPAMARSVVEDQLPQISRIIHQVMADQATGSRLPFVFFNQKLSSSIVGHLMMDTIPSDAELREFFEYADALTVTLAVLRLPRAVLQLRGKRFRRARALTHDLMERVVSRALTQPHDRRLIVDIVQEARKELPDLFTDGDVQGTGFLAFFLGIDTLGQTTAFMLWQLLRHPETLARVQAEIDAVFGAGGGLPTADDLMSALPLLRGAFLETLRLHPTGFGLVRQAAKDFEFGGVRVSAGRDVMIYTTICHRMAEYFPDPQHFDIDRYGPDRQEDRQRGVYAPFGRGPHKCMGASWADAQVLLTVGTLLYHYCFALPRDMVHVRPQMRTTPTLGPTFRMQYLGPRDTGHPARTQVC